MLCARHVSWDDNNLHNIVGRYEIIHPFHILDGRYNLPSSIQQWRYNEGNHLHCREHNQNQLTVDHLEKSYELLRYRQPISECWQARSQRPTPFASTIIYCCQLILFDELVSDELYFQIEIASVGLAFQPGCEEMASYFRSRAVSKE